MLPQPCEEKGKGLGEVRNYGCTPISLALAPVLALVPVTEPGTGSSVLPVSDPAPVGKFSSSQVLVLAWVYHKREHWRKMFFVTTFCTDIIVLFWI